MASITPSVAPGYYSEHQSVEFVFSSDVVAATVTESFIAPSVCLQTAFDRQTVPKPLFAATADGKGRVLFDTGYYKYQNGNLVGWNDAPSRPTTFAALNASQKLLYNAVNWIADPVKVAKGNKNVLILGDKGESDDYLMVREMVFKTNETGFMTTIQSVLGIAGYTAVIKSRIDYGSVSNFDLDPTLTELEQYCCVLVFSTLSTGVNRITDRGLNNLLTYRERGGGIMVTTAGGPTLASIDAVGTETGVTRTANQIACRLGAYYSGTFDRMPHSEGQSKFPMNIGVLRSTYGDHPLYNGIDNSEDLITKTGETQILLNAATSYTPETLPAFTTSKSGVNIFNVQGMTITGEYVSARYVYNIEGAEFLLVSAKDASGEIVLSPETIKTTATQAWNIHLGPDSSVYGTMSGIITITGEDYKHQVGEFYSEVPAGQTLPQTTTLLYSRGALPRASVGESLNIEIKTPFEYTKTMQVVSDPLPTAQGITRASLVDEAVHTAFPGFPLVPGKNMRNLTSEVHYQDSAYASLYTKKKSRTANSLYWRDLWRGELVGGTVEAPYAKTVAQLNSLLTSYTPAPATQFFVELSQNKIYVYSKGQYKALQGTTASEALPTPCRITYEGSTVLLRPDGSWEDV